MKNLWIYIFLILLSQNLFSQEFSNKVWLKSGAVIGFNNLDLFKYGFRDSSGFRIYFDKIDSLKTTDSSVIKNLSDSYRSLQLTKEQDGILIKGFDILHGNSFNVAMEIAGKLIAGGFSVGYVKQGIHSFDLAYGSGYTVTIFSDSANVKYLVSLSYSYLMGMGSGNFKGEFGTGFSIGQVTITPKKPSGFIGGI